MGLNGFLAIGQFESGSVSSDKTPMGLFATFEEAEQWVEDYVPHEADVVFNEIAAPDWFALVKFENGLPVADFDEGSLIPDLKGRSPETLQAIAGVVANELQRRERWCLMTKHHPNTYRSTMCFYLGQLMQHKKKADRELWKNKILDFALSVDPGEEAKAICEMRKREGLMD